MADKSAFSPDEWGKVLGSVMLTSMAVTLSDQSGLWGMLKESIASSSSLVGASTDPNANALVKAVVEDYKTSEGRGAAQAAVKAVFANVASPEDAQAKAVEALKSVADIVSRKAPNDAAAFGAFLQSVGEKTAEASNEGGFLGFGGVAVSEAEKAMLEKIAGALGARAGTSA